MLDTGARRLAGAQELLESSAGDPYVRAWVDPARLVLAWRNDEAHAWLVASRRAPDRLHLNSIGSDVAAAELLLSLPDELQSSVASVTLPRNADRHLPSYVLRPRNDWEWFVTWTPPPVQPREREVRWLDDAPHEELALFLQHWSPRHDAKPGAPGVLSWCGVRGDDGELLAVAAHTEHVPGVPHLASIATSGASRGQGYGAAVTAWLTRSLLEAGTGWVTLGMYSDNSVARQMYLRLGYQCDHYLTSGGLATRGSGAGPRAP